MATFSEVDEQMRTQVSEMSSQLTQWVTEQKAVADAVATKARTTLQSDKENIEQLREQQHELKAAGEQLVKQGRELHDQQEELSRDLERLTAQEARLPSEHQRYSQQLSQSRALVTQNEASVEAAQQQMEHKLGELNRGKELYSNRLGLTFDKVGDDRLRLTFTSIDSAQPDRQFFVEVRVTAGDQYVVEHCEPMVPDLRALTDTLNTTNDFSAYVRNLRRRFKALVTA